jgi:hypothetical protein
MNGIVKGMEAGAQVHTGLSAISIRSRVRFSHVSRDALDRDERIEPLFDGLAPVAKSEIEKAAFGIAMPRESLLTAGARG